MAKKNRLSYVFASVSFVLAALGSKISYAYWASAIIGDSTNTNGSVTSGTWDRYSTGTAVSDCTILQTALTTKTSKTYYLTQNLGCPNISLPNTNRVFSGKFYGNGYTISNITLTNYRPGLFYSLSGATIQNLILDNINFGSTNRRASAASGILASAVTGSGTQISKIRINNSSIYANTTYGAGGIIGRATSSVTISNVLLDNVMINNTAFSTSTGSAGVVGKLSTTVTISDVYFEGNLSGRYNCGGVVGNIDNSSTSLLTVSRAVIYANTSFNATTRYSGGIVGRNQRSANHSLSDVLFTGSLYSPSSYAGTIYNGNAMTYSNAWASAWSWDGYPDIDYTEMTGTSADYSTNYYEDREELTALWWETYLSSIVTSYRWIYDDIDCLYRLKPMV